MASQNPLDIAMVLRLFSPNGGLELYALKLVEGLLADGHKITVICEKDESNLSHERLAVELFPPPRQELSKAERLKYYREATTEAVKRLGPFHIVHSHHFPVVPVDVVTFHNHTARRLSLVGYRWERWLNSLKFDWVPAYQARDQVDHQLAVEAAMRIFVGAVMKEDFYQSFELPDLAPYTVAHPGASMSTDDLTTKTHNLALSSDKSFNFLFVGKGFRKKGLDTLLKACSILKKRGHNFTLCIAGIKDRPTSRLQLQLAGLADHVRYLGFRHDMPAVYAASHATVLPSKIEPFGMAPIQGMQYGLVPIVSKVCGVAEVLHDGEDCLILHNHLDSKELADLMEKLITDRELYKRLAQQAKDVAGSINWRQTVDATEAAYESVLQTRQRSHQKD